jgi:dynein heavy chain 1
MDEISLRTSPGLSFVEYLSKPQMRIKWEQETLPNDELCIQNAIILDRFNRYPLVIDPSNQALPFLLNHYDSPKRKLQKTSFADDAFLNHLVNAIRFGLPLVVQDVEMIDPFLNSVLNKEV